MASSLRFMISPLAANQRHMGVWVERGEAHQAAVAPGGPRLARPTLLFHLIGLDTQRRKKRRLLLLILTVDGKKEKWEEAGADSHNMTTMGELAAGVVDVVSAVRVLLRFGGRLVRVH